MPLVTITEAAKSFDVSRSTLYEKVKTGELSRNADKLIDTADLLRLFGEPGQSKSEHSSSAQPNVVTTGLLDMVNSQREELTQVRAQLDDTKNRLNEQREAARALVSPDDVKKKEVEWKVAMAERQQQIEAARTEANEIRERVSSERAAWKDRGLIDRLLNREPKTVES